jgi:dipeptidyl aminopeptidase/acylaminoacyl peptidase
MQRNARPIHCAHFFSGFRESAMPFICRRVSQLAALWSASLGIASAAEAPAPSTIPLQAFATLPAIQQPRLSPDGRSVALVQNVDGKSYVVVTSFGAKPKVVLHTDNDKYTLTWVRWAGNERLLIGARYPEERRGVRTVETRLIAIDRDGGNLKGDLTNALRRSFLERPTYLPQFQDRIIGTVPGEPDTVLLAFASKAPGQPDVYRLDVRSGRSQLVQHHLGGVHYWMADAQGEVRLGIGAIGTTQRVLVKPPASAGRSPEWTTLASHDALDAAQARVQALTPLGFDADPRFLYALAPVDGRDALVRLDLQDPAFARETLLADARFDIRGALLRDPSTQRVVGIDYITDVRRSLYWDEATRRRQELLDRALPGRSNRVVSSDEGGQRSVVLSAQDARPGQYFFMDWTDGRPAPLGDIQPELEKQPLATPRRITLRSRDGLLLEGNLTLPPADEADAAAGAQPSKPLPAILLPHGGPAAAYATWSQFFASRGWAVLQLNFRGSKGYGQDFREAGRRRWGLEMQDDLADGRRWLVDQGIADTTRVCIVGSGFGGYAALMGAVKDQALYRCVVSFAGPTDLRDLLGHAQRFLGYELGAEAEIGTWWGDREQLRQTSPALRAAEIRIPVLLMHGANDLTVPVEQSRDMADALKKANHADARYVELPLGDHDLSRQEDRARVLTEMERFLAKHLDDRS